MCRSQSSKMSIRSNATNKMISKNIGQQHQTLDETKLTAYGENMENKWLTMTTKMTAKMKNMLFFRKISWNWRYFDILWNFPQPNLSRYILCTWTNTIDCINSRIFFYWKFPEIFEFATVVKHVTKDLQIEFFLAVHFNVVCCCCITVYSNLKT